MRTANRYVWVFIVVVTCLDIWFTWQFQGSASLWEVNPIATLFMQWKGALAAILYRTVWLSYAVIMAQARTRFSWLVAPVWGIGHAYLLIILVRSYSILAL